VKIRWWLLAASLLGSSALPATAAAQPSPGAQPTGGTVVAGTASIGAPRAGGVVIKQSSQRAAIDWTSFDVGSKESVEIKAPSGSSVTLLSVLGGDASQIAGSVKSNGVVLLVDASGAELFPGSTLAGASVLTGAPGISTQNFMAGNLVFDGAVNPDAAIVNGGSIKVRQAGAAVLLGPGIENRGEITARLGEALLISGQSATISQLNSGAAAVQITSPSTQAPVAADGQMLPAMITQSGSIEAAGGTIGMLASANSGVSQNVVENTGRVAADTVGSTTGSIQMDGSGGGVSVDGRVRAVGGAGELGGSIELLADSSNAVTVGAQAILDASGAGGGGTIALGTTEARAVGGPSVTAPVSSAVDVASGAGVTVDATTDGNGGHITALSTTETAFAGTASATGGPAGGNGGQIEISSAGTVDLTDSSLDVGAPAGSAGTILLDPAILIP
jgi:filamentous hemagglutinin family protein